MADQVDIAQRNQLNQIKVERKDYSKPSLSECIECGNDIPLQRQKLGAVTLCIDCATYVEQKRKHEGK
ncbi:TraR/DksA C4-type zinc finger protein [Acinetobacter sp. B5B]|uniref:TraR/DksA C4-type zinc finger protein n=1 Tax=Acinetobacter baretiae TaxID=2605383 RepID=UPI0018C2C9AC|nr:TraR/DksA C4-type zinc finger protein [Acinetobacter baretiae]MBF7683881.1 TraR/DksA C4-type zinc finger protein [Acinetobacter baretiae]